MKITSLDLLIILSVAVGFLVFFIFHILLLRRVEQKKIIVQIKKSYFLGLIVVILFLNLNVFAVFLAVFLYTLLALFFVLAFWGMLQSSLRIKLLLYVGSKKNGVNVKDVKEKFSVEEIVKERLDRLVESGDLAIIEGKYQLHNKISYFYFHAFMFELLSKFIKKKRKI